MTIPSDEFTLFESVPTEESSIELARAGTDQNSEAAVNSDEAAVNSDEANTSESSLGFETLAGTTPPPMVRRHRFPHFFPLLTLCRYFAIVYATSFVTTEFATPSIRHTAVCNIYHMTHKNGT